jgi:peptidoglycan/xylan/chitin deacetylase (PgdA/CDA1 family)
VKEFEQDLDFLLKHYTPIDFHTLKTNLPTKKNTFLLSFDDGLREFHDVIAPVLLRKGIPAVCFLNSGFIDNKDLFFRYKTSLLLEKLINGKISDNLRKEVSDWFENKGLSTDYQSLLSINYLNKNRLDELAEMLEIDFQDYLQKVQPYLTTGQIQNLITQGFDFGAHSIDHPQFSDLTEATQSEQIRQSIQAVTENFRLNYKTFSFPFTDYGVSTNFFHTVFDKDNPLADITFGCAGLKKDSCPKNLQRIPAEIDDFSLQEVVHGEYLYYICKSLLNKNIINRKKYGN